MPHGAPPIDSRRVVTVLFSDVASSTVLGEALDPESLRRLMGRYFQEVHRVLHRHGGSTEKFIGDAVMAVFGVPRSHEDDALRAVRAAVEMRQVLQGLNEEFERHWAVRIAVRTGINTGEVIAGDPNRLESFVVGDTVNVAARLEQVADPDQILIGEATHRLVREAVSAGRVAPLTVKGKREPLAAWEVLDVTPGAPGWVRRLDSPLVDRTVELRLLDAAFERAVQEQNCQVVTVIGDPGVGKSRLAMEFVSRLGTRVTVVSGRCLPYGEGITFWPVEEVLRGMTGVGSAAPPDEAMRKILRVFSSTPEAELIGDRLAALLGLSTATPAIQETFWAVRKLFEEVAARQPLVVVFEDIHWGESTFLDLLEYLADWLRGVPVALICLARGDLLEARGGWLSGKANAETITLRPLNGDEIDDLIGNLIGAEPAPHDTLAHLADVAEGNPLFVEELFRMLMDDGRLQRINSTWTISGDLATIAIPATIQALLTARLDRLEWDELAVIRTASVIGRQFWWGAVSELSPTEQRATVGSTLQSLARKDLIRPDHSELSDEHAFRFDHILIRDAAYRGIPKAVRADLHERFADWLEGKTQDRSGQFEEITGYHLEQSFRSLSELSTPNERTASLGRRAGLRLASAGRRAFARGDMPAAVNLLSRAVPLFPPEDTTLAEIQPDLAFALLETGDFERMRSVVARMTERAASSGDPVLQAQVSVLGLWMRVFTDPEGWAAEALAEATQAIKTFDEHHHEPGLARGWSLLGLVHLFDCQFGTSEEAWERAASHAQAAGNEREALEYLSWIPLVVWGGPTPVEQAIARCRDVLDRANSDRKAMSTATFVAAKLEAMRGRFDAARDAMARARAIAQEGGLTVWIAGPLAQMSGWVDVLAGDPAKAERDLRSSVQTLQEVGELSWLSTVAGILAEAMYAQGRFDEVDEPLRICEETAGSEDAYSQSLLRSVRAKLLARRGEFDQAVASAREAVGVAEPTDFLFMQGFALLALGEVLQLAGRSEEAEAMLKRATRVCDAKGFTVGNSRARGLMG